MLIKECKVILHNDLVSVVLFIGYVIRQGDVITFFLKSIPYLFCTFIFFLTAARGKQRHLLCEHGGSRRA